MPALCPGAIHIYHCTQARHTLLHPLLLFKVLGPSSWLPHPRRTPISKLACGSPAPPAPAALRGRLRRPRLWDPDVPSETWCQGRVETTTLGKGALGFWEARPGPGDPAATVPWPKLLTCLPGGGGRCRHRPAVVVSPAEPRGQDWPAVLGGDTGSVKPYEVTGAVALPVPGEPPGLGWGHWVSLDSS